jgi:nicotinamidase-related amidase
MPLLTRADCQLVVIDMQPGFYPPAAEVDRERLALVAARVAWLAGVAAALEVPVTVTEEDPDRNGRTAAGVLGQLHADTPVFAKTVFGLSGQPEIIATLDAHRRMTAVLAGIETDVCVAQSAIGLLERGYRVAVVADATYAPGEMHEHGLRRMRDAGATLVHAKGVYYEWVRTLEEARRFQADHPGLGEPPGFSL